LSEELDNEGVSYRLMRTHIFNNRPAGLSRDKLKMGRRSLRLSINRRNVEELDDCYALLIAGMENMGFHHLPASSSKAHVYMMILASSDLWDHMKESSTDEP